MSIFQQPVTQRNEPKRAQPNARR